MSKEAEVAFDKLKAGAKKVTDPSKDLGDEYDKEKGKERASDYDQTNESGARSNVTRKNSIS